MPSLKIIFLPLIILICFSGFSQSKQISGVYSSNYAQCGMFGERLELLRDSTFRYVFAGDLIHQTRSGTYYIANHIIYLNFLPTIDTITGYDDDSTVWSESKTSPPLMIYEGIPTGIKYVTDSFPGERTKMYFRRNKLYYVSDNWKIGTRLPNGYRKHKKYCLVKRKNE